MATITVIQPSIMTETVKRRVAAYCRVSGGSEDQLNSYQAQLTYYSHKFEDSDTEELVDLYADEGITGTRDDKRDEFQRLMKDCRRGKIDRIYTKSISRFARNTKDCLKNLRELKALGITVIFEKENIDTANMTDEIMITILGGLAQEESVSISQNMRWSIQKRMENGSFKASLAPYGYDIEHGKLSINPVEAEVVVWIYQSYLSGIGINTITNQLNQRKIPSSKYGKMWSRNTVKYILTNEKYIGSSLLYKKYSTGAFPYKKKINKGEIEQYLIENTHPSIISENDFRIVQRIIAENTKCAYTQIREEVFYQKIYCSVCNCTYKRKKVNGRVHWVCRTHEKKADSCPCKAISQIIIYRTFIALYNKLLYHYHSILIPIQQMLQELKCKKYGGNIRVMDIHKEIAKLREQNHVIARLRTKGFMDEGKYQEQSKELNNKIRKLQAELKKTTRSDEEDETLEQIEMLTDLFEKREHLMTEFEPDVFESIVDRIVVKSRNELEFHLIGGLKLTEKN